MFPILTAISVISLGRGVADVNVALNKPVYYCKDVRKYTSMTDGSVYFRNAEIISGECESGSYVRVDLLEQYFVHYVVVFEGPSMQSDLNQAGLDYFLVEFVGIDEKVTMCSAFAKKSIGPQEGKGMRVNCIRALASIVMIKSRQTKGISIAELEVYTMASGVPKETAVHYQGCYAEFSHLVFHPIEASRDCLQKCAQGEDKYGAVRKNTCYCGPAFNDQKKVADAKCSNKCTKTNCDAPDLYTVYLVQVQLPVYLGCLKRNVSGDTIKGTMTIYRCVLHCGSLGHIQANIMEGNECKCSSKENEKHFENIVHCDIPCTGNKEQFCGGNGYTSTYQLGLLMFETKLFTDLDCFKDAPDIYCNSSCRAGYTGEHCLTSDHKLTTRKSRPTTASESTSTKISTIRSTGISEVNVALKKPASYCNFKKLLPKITDGFKNVHKAEVISQLCRPKSYVDIDLDMSHYIHYVVVYEGPPLDKGPNAGGLDYFLVYFVNNDKTLSPCSAYPRLSIGPLKGKGMKVNCVTTLANHVRIISRLSKGMSISEIEVYSLASGIPNEVVMLYMGCFSYLYNGNIFNVETGKECLGACGKEGDYIGGIQVKKCHCGMFFSESDRLDDSKCDYSCGDIVCGGKDAISVYIVNIQLPTSKGCLEVFPDMNYTHLEGNMTYYKCVWYCRHTNFAALKEGNECVCYSREYKGDIEDDGKVCNIPCSGNNEEICGGKRHAKSILTGATLSNLRYLEIALCFENIENGDCVGNCKPGYTGEYCNGTYDDYVSSSTKSVKYKSSLPGDRDCSDGYLTHKVNDTCIDIDECDLSSCDENTSNCSNSPGSFVCVCKPGFVHGAVDTCIDPKGKGSTLNRLSKPSSLLFIIVLLPIFVAICALLTMICVAPPASEGKISNANIQTDGEE